MDFLALRNIFVAGEKISEAQENIFVAGENECYVL